MPKSSKCKVKGCTNWSHQGGFEGELCTPCHSFLNGKTGGQCSQAARNSQKPLSKKVQSKIMAIIDYKYGAIKGGDLLTEVIVALGGWKDRVSILQSRLMATLTLMESEDRIGITRYQMRSGSTYEEKIFVFRPLPEGLHIDAN